MSWNGIDLLNMGEQSPKIAYSGLKRCPRSVIGLSKSLNIETDLDAEIVLEN